jgi:flagella basal body P-ring formation protein FlgA
MVRKTGLTLLMILAVLAGVVILPHTARAVSLKQNTVVNGDTIVLGDVFQGLPANEDKVLGLAPQPGQEMVLNARTLLRIAIALDLPWRPASNNDHIVLTRAASVVDREMIKNAILTELEKDTLEGKYTVVIPDAAAQIVLSPDIAPTVEITDFNYKPESGWFEATAVAPSVDNPIRRQRINGVVHKLVDVPVLRTVLNAGDIIGERDIDLIEMKESDVRADMIKNSADLIGMTPRRMTVSGKPMKAADLESPRIVTRGDIVTMQFSQGGMTLTASGKAMEHGARGDTIRVVNSTSNKTIEATVTGSKEVTITSF